MSDAAESAYPLSDRNRCVADRHLGPADPDELPPKSVLARGLRLLDAFGARDVDLTLAELAERSGLPKPTVHRLARELVEWGGLERTGGGYRLGLALFVLGQRVPRQRTLRDAALPHLEDLYEVTHENVHLSVLDGVHTLFLEKVSGRRSMPLGSRVGDRMPAYCTATGKVLLAYAPEETVARVVDQGFERYTPRTIVVPAMLRQDLARIVERGYGVNWEEAHVGVSAVAAPVFDHREVVAAISVTGYSKRLNLEQLAPVVRTAARALSRELSAASHAVVWPSAAGAS
jgi:DNA-binding IclR family transcriptional regulator